MNAAIDQFKNVQQALTDDVAAAKGLHAARESDFTRRMVVKTMFTYLEGHLYALKQVILDFEHILNPWQLQGIKDSRIVLFTDEERAMLEEYTYDLSSGGVARKTLYLPRFADNIKFAFTLFQRAVRLEDTVNYNSEGWQRLLESQKIRNRLTHPRSTESLSVVEAEVATVEKGVAWYDNNVDALFHRLEHESIYTRRFPRKD